MKVFFDRYDAGRQLATQLMRYSDTDAIIYALPRGGVLVGYEVAKALHLPLDILITRKIRHPLYSEMAISAITEEGKRVNDSRGLCGIDASWIQHETAIALREAQRRRREYKSFIQPHSPAGKVVILVDDGIATGLTMKAAISSIKLQNPAKVVVATPVCPHDVFDDLTSLVDEIVLLIDTSHYRGSVGAYYEHFPEVFDKEVIICLKNAQFHAEKSAAHNKPTQKSIT